MVAFVGFLCSTKSGILTHCPQARAVHAWMNAACKRKFAWIAQLSVSVEICQIFFCGQVRYFNTRAGCKVWFTFDGLFFRFICCGVTPFISVFTLMQIHADPPSDCLSIIAYEEELKTS